MPPARSPSRLRPLYPRKYDRVVATLAALCAGVCAVVFVLGMAFPTGDANSSRRSGKGSTGYVLIYSGSAVCEGCAEAIGDVVVAAGFPVRYAGRPAKVPSLLAGASAFVVPGTDGCSRHRRWKR